MQYLEQVNARVLGSLLGNVGNLIAFRVGPRDAETLAKEFAPVFSPEDLVSVPNHRAYVRMMIDGVPSRPFSARLIDRRPRKDTID
jgi:hypothetical protein